MPSLCRPYNHSLILQPHTPHVHTTCLLATHSYSPVIEEKKQHLNKKIKDYFSQHNHPPQAFVCYSHPPPPQSANVEGRPYSHPLLGQDSIASVQFFSPPLLSPLPPCSCFASFQTPTKPYRKKKKLKRSKKITIKLQTYFFLFAHNGRTTNQQASKINTKKRGSFLLLRTRCSLPAPTSLQCNLNRDNALNVFAHPTSLPSFLPSFHLYFFGGEISKKKTPKPVCGEENSPHPQPNPTQPNTPPPLALPPFHCVCTLCPTWTRQEAKTYTSPPSPPHPPHPSPLFLPPPSDTRRANRPSRC
eukprot:Rhum_TRINITY_DN14356_c7_g1::Rhum_TRINITY_DN14356_c7_g1_i1::g.84590::m.84590